MTVLEDARRELTPLMNPEQDDSRLIKNVIRSCGHAAKKLRGGVLRYPRHEQKQIAALLDRHTFEKSHMETLESLLQGWSSEINFWRVERDAVAEHKKVNE